MAKDLIIGGISNYGYDQVKYWINSAQRSNFKGDIVLLATNIKAEEITKIAAKGVIIKPYGQETDGNYTNQSSLPPHVERFFAIYDYLRTCGENYRYVITTDVRDVVFQMNPSHWLDFDTGDIITASEGLLYEDEPWGRNNYIQAFGPFFYELIKNKPIYNVGVIAGKHRSVQDLMLLILQLSVNRPIPIVDQAVYNFLLNTRFVDLLVEPFGNDAGWTINLGTTLAAIQSGAGDIGKNNDPTSQILYQTKYLSEQPIIEGDTVLNSKNIPFVIVHQYDRVSGLVDLIRSKFDD